MIGINFGNGSTVVIRYIRNGVEHQTVRFSTDLELGPNTGSGFEQAIRKFYESVGAEVVSISKIESMEICCGDGSAI